MRVPSLCLLLLCLPAAACMSTLPEAKPLSPAEQRAFAAALVQMCDVDSKAAIDGDALVVGAKRTAWITENVGNPEVIELRVLMSVKGAPEQAVMLRDRARSAGITRCALAETLAKTGEGGLSP